MTPKSEVLVIDFCCEEQRENEDLIEKRTEGPWVRLVALDAGEMQRVQAISPLLITSASLLLVKMA